MSDRSTIEWTDATWNPVTGCTKVSPGCDHCYAEAFAERFRDVAGHPYEQGFDLRLWPERLTIPLRWKQPRRVFVNSMSDLFHKDVPDDFILQVFGVMAASPVHTFQVLTKRPDRMLRLLRLWTEAGRPLRCALRGYQVERCWPLPNVWLGTSIETMGQAWRADKLRRTPAVVRFISAEPLLGPLADLDLTGIDWVIAGGESGPEARPGQPAWFYQLHARCRAAGVAFFMKQLGSAWARQLGLRGRGHRWDDLPPGLRVREYPGQSTIEPHPEGEPPVVLEQLGLAL